MKGIQIGEDYRDFLNSHLGDVLPGVKFMQFDGDDHELEIFLRDGEEVSDNTQFFLSVPKVLPKETVFAFWHAGDTEDENWSDAYLYFGVHFYYNLRPARTDRSCVEIIQQITERHIKFDFPELDKESLCDEDIYFYVGMLKKDMLEQENYEDVLKYLGEAAREHAEHIAVVYRFFKKPEYWAEMKENFMMRQ